MQVKSCPSHAQPHVESVEAPYIQFPLFVTCQRNHTTAAELPAAVNNAHFLCRTMYLMGTTEGYSILCCGQVSSTKV